MQGLGGALLQGGAGGLWTFPRTPSCRPGRPRPRPAGPAPEARLVPGMRLAALTPQRGPGEPPDGAS